ncbi:MAG: hypothetical protein RIQ52_1528 [Pseudomonadota bacterium]|jgi:CRP/FNR family transcriptional regulator
MALTEGSVPDWGEAFPAFLNSGDPVIEHLMACARMTELAAEQMVFQPGSQCDHYHLLLHGAIRVFVTTPGGREIFLYRVRRGEGCVMTASCLLGSDPYNVFGISEGSVSAYSVPAHVFHQSLSQSLFFRTFVFQGFGARLASVLSRLEDLMEGNIDQMLVDALMAFSQHGCVNMTHQALADQIGTAREVVSRHLKHFELMGWVKLSRGRIILNNTAALSLYAKT